MWAKGVAPAAACFGCLCFGGTILFVFAPITYFVVFPTKSALGPGDETRRTLEPHLLSSLQTGDWTKVDENFSPVNAAMIIGDKSGVRYKVERGWMKLDTEYAIASETKMITALTIYRLMQRSNGVLRPDSRVADFIEGWPQDAADPGSRVTMAHLLSFTTGWNFTSLDRVKCYTPRHATTWTECLEELVRTKIDHEPGTSFIYGAPHLVVAAAVTHKALGKELTASSWGESVRGEVFLPSGVEDKPNFDGCRSEFPVFFPHWGNWFRGANKMPFPDFASGMRMTGEEYQRILNAVMFGGLLSEVLMKEFTADHTTQVSKWLGHVGPRTSLLAGTWHYAQGSWLTCDALTNAIDNGTASVHDAQTKACATPTPKIIHSLGFWGFYAWMDLTNSYFGVFVYSWAFDLVRMFWIAFGVSLVISLVTCYTCGVWLNPASSKKTRAESSMPLKRQVSDSSDSDSEAELCW